MPTDNNNERAASAAPVSLPSTTELIELLRRAYGAVPTKRLGQSRCIEFDPAGSTYEFTEHDWSKRIREILGYEHGPSGI